MEGMKDKMTAQISDTFILKGTNFELIGIDGGELVSPEKFGMVPTTMHTACYRGYYSTYEIIDSELTLRELTLSEENGNYLPINGINPEKEEYQATYHDLDLVVEFTGKLRLARNLIEEFYIHMGFQKASAYKIVLDFTVKEGKIVEMKDRSKDAKRKRGEFKKRYKSGDMIRMIDEAFDLDMDLE